MKRLLLPLLSALLLTTAHAAVIFNETFDTYDDKTGLNPLYNDNSNTAILLTGGLGNSRALDFLGDSTMIRDTTAFAVNITQNIGTVEVFFLWNGETGFGLAAPQIGLLTVSTGGFGGTQDVGVRLNNNRLVLRSNNADVITPTASNPSVTPVAGNWYALSFSATRTANTNEMFLETTLYNADAAGVKGTVVATSSATAVNSQVWGDADGLLFAAMRVNSTRIDALDNFSLSQTPVPEPGAFTLAALAFGAVILRRRRA
jgi:hypothetical protein